MAEYEQQQRATLERTARLRAARLAREAKQNAAEDPPKKAGANKKRASTNNKFA